MPLRLINLFWSIKDLSSKKTKTLDVVFSKDFKFSGPPKYKKSSLKSKGSLALW
ncbi:hypothetical protein MSSD1_463 [Mycoplasmopsis synoviae]